MPLRDSSTRPPQTAYGLAIEPISMRIADACQFTGLNRSTIYVLIGQGQISTVKVGRPILVLTESPESSLLS